jgi:hypothetical protein
MSAPAPSCTPLRTCLGRQHTSNSSCCHVAHLTTLLHHMRSSSRHCMQRQQAWPWPPQGPLLHAPGASQLNPWSMAAVEEGSSARDAGKLVTSCNYRGQHSVCMGRRAGERLLAEVEQQPVGGGVQSWARWASASAGQLETDATLLELTAKAPQLIAQHYRYSGPPHHRSAAVRGWYLSAFGKP